MIETNKIYNEDCLETMKQMPDNLLDSIVTDPPYGLSFMGKKWDYEVPSVEIWKECMRVLKPGGYLLSFAGTRTQHRMACNIEDAGFEIRDMIAWVYGSGFPKSLNIGKAVDKLNGNKREIVGEIRAGSTAMGQNSGWNDHNNKTVMDLTRGNSEWEGWGTALKPSWESITVAQKSFQSCSDIDNLVVSLLKQIKKGLCQYQSFALTAEKNLRSSQKELKEDVSIAQWIADDNINIQEDFCVLTDMLRSELENNSSWNIVLSWLNILADLWESKSISTTSMESNLIIELKILNSMEWESIFQNIMQIKDNQTNGLNVNVWNVEAIFNVLKLKLNYTQKHFAQENATLKENGIDFAPNLEPIIMSRKPLSEHTVADNVLKWGTGGINIDASRIETKDEIASVEGGIKRRNKINQDQGFRPYEKGFDNQDKEIWEQHSQGRFPANFIHDGSEEVVGLFPETGQPCGGIKKTTHKDGMFGIGTPGTIYTEYDNGNNSASRFFYCAKASKSERNAGLNGMEEKFFNDLDKMGGEKCGMKTGSGNPRNGKNQNNHPTVKPVTLIKYLIQLVTRPNGLVYDPFGGSGTLKLAAQELKMNWIISEIDKDYCQISENRELPNSNQMSIFDVIESVL